jgi:hypothetical protein
MEARSVRVGTERRGFESPLSESGGVFEGDLGNVGSSPTETEQQTNGESCVSISSGPKGIE